MGKKAQFMPWGIAILLLPLLFTYNNCSGEKSTTENSSTSPLGGGGGGAPVVDKVAGEAFFKGTVVPVFESRCTSCHDQPRFGGTAPLSIFIYGDMSALLNMGENSTDNQLINIMQNISDHDGGNVCPTGITGSPCKEVMEWRKVERPDDEGGGLGTISFLSLQGEGSGWAKDPDNDVSQIAVEIYADGPKESGVLVGTFDADETGVGGTYGGHYFSFSLPTSLKDGTNRQLYVYAQIQGEDVLLPGMPLDFVAYTPTAQGQAFFNNTVRPQLNCNSCHVWDYNTAFGTILRPAPASGGTAMNNSFINFSSGGGGHPGGNYCRGGKNSGLCADLQQWWNLEFQ